jgi:hypothetical protein
MDRQPSSESFKIAGGKISGVQPDENYFPEYSYEWIQHLSGNRHQYPESRPADCDALRRCD